MFGSFLARFAALSVLGVCLSGVGHSLAASGSTDVGWDRLVTGVIAGDVTDVPVGFEDVMGYSPALENGRLVRPDGNCSSPLSPPEFEFACRAHDFGYDLLRFGERTGRRPSLHLRRVIDAQFHQDMLDACEDLACRGLAHVFSLGVGLNSVRQGYTPPGREPILPWLLAGGVVLGLSLYGGSLTGLPDGGGEGGKSLGVASARR